MRPHSTKIRIVCATCGTPFSVFPSSSYRKFCSRPCIRHSPKPRLGFLGYWTIWIDGKDVLYHRWLMEQHLGRPLAPGEEVHHKDSDRANNQIDNLLLCASHADHMRLHRRRPERQRRPRYKLTPLQVQEMRALHATGTLTMREIAQQFSVNQSAVSRIVNRLRWAHVP